MESGQWACGADTYRGWHGVSRIKIYFYGVRSAARIRVRVWSGEGGSNETLKSRLRPPSVKGVVRFNDDGPPASLLIPVEDARCRSAPDGDQMHDHQVPVHRFWLHATAQSCHDSCHTLGSYLHST